MKSTICFPSVFLCQGLKFLRSFQCSVEYTSPSNISFSWMDVLVNNGTNPFTPAACAGWWGKRMVISRRGKWKGGSSTDIQIADRGFYHHLTNVPHARLTLGNRFGILYHLVIPAVVAAWQAKSLFTAHLCHERQSTSKFRTPNSSWPHPGRPYVSVPKTKLLSSRARLCKSVQTENTVYSVMCTTSPA